MALTDISSVERLRINTVEGQRVGYATLVTYLEVARPHAFPRTSCNVDKRTASSRSYGRCRLISKSFVERACDVGQWEAYKKGYALHAQCIAQG